MVSSVKELTEGILKREIKQIRLYSAGDKAVSQALKRMEDRIDQRSCGEGLIAVAFGDQTALPWKNRIERNWHQRWILCLGKKRLGENGDTVAGFAQTNQKWGSVTGEIDNWKETGIPAAGVNRVFDRMTGCIDIKLFVA